MEQLYDTTKKLIEKYDKTERSVKDKEGQLTTKIQGQRNRWVKYFEKLLNRSVPLNPPYTEAALTDPPIDATLPKIKEIRMGIR
ncbi:unnamed protein product [Schistosoma margrebowiei]|uniref:Uncharacterized protein n=1 Tax=Schistosoma margrebowiei TaxID=48269 RepID=A0A183MGC3_9TREM|nr:unnamed protein product [Schistosoma margrebowiei]